MLLVGRVLLGLGAGIGFVVFAAYISEVAPESIRGALVASQEILQVLGTFFKKPGQASLFLWSRALWGRPGSLYQTGQVYASACDRASETTRRVTKALLKQCAASSGRKGLLTSGHRPCCNEGLWNASRLC